MFRILKAPMVPFEDKGRRGASSSGGGATPSTGEGAFGCGPKCGLRCDYFQMTFMAAAATITSPSYLCCSIHTSKNPPRHW